MFVLWTQNLNSHHELIAGGGLHDFDIGLPNRFLVEIQQGSYRIAAGASNKKVADAAGEGYGRFSNTELLGRVGRLFSTTNNWSCVKATYCGQTRATTLRECTRSSGHGSLA